MATLGALGDLVLALSADTAKFQSDLGRAQRVADKFGRDVGKALGNVAGALVALGGSAGFTALVKGQIDAADAAGKMAQKVGIGVEQLSANLTRAGVAVQAFGLGVAKQILPTLEQMSDKMVEVAKAGEGRHAADPK